MIRISKLSFVLGLAIFCAVVAPPAAIAGPVYFSGVTALPAQPGGAKVDLFSNPGATLIGPQLDFQVDYTGLVPPGMTNTVLITYLEAGGVPLTRSFEIPVFGSIQPPFSNIVSFISPGASYEGVMASLTIDILGSSPDFVIPGGPNAGQMVDSYTYHFKVAKPVPEPLSLLLFGTGVLGAWQQASRLRRKRRRNWSEESLKR
jgi:hypothetical protein